jgi:hypothetical protein
MMNAHVALYYRLRCLQAAEQRNYLAQWFYYTLAELEIDPDWKSCKSVCEKSQTEP